MPLLIYCESRAEVERVVNSFERQSVVSVTSGADVGGAAVMLHSGEANVVVATIHAAATGWRAPAGTIVLFTAAVAGRPDLEPHRRQAAARVPPVDRVPQDILEMQKTALGLIK